MKKELLELLPKKSPKERIKSDVEIVEEFFMKCTELQQVIHFEVDGEYSVKLDDLEKIKCPLKRHNDKDYWEAFFILLGFEYYFMPRTRSVKLIVR